MIAGSRLARYLPLAAVIMVQALIILIAPSKAPEAEEIAAFQGDGGGGSTFDGSAGDGGSSDPFGSDTGSSGGSGDGAGGGTSGTTGGTGGSGGGGDTGGGGGGGDTGGGGGGGGTAGDTSHCVSGRQFDPAIWAYAPPCVPQFSGNNGGQTYKVGVTAEKVNVVVYDANLGAAVEAILEAQGSNPSAEQMQAFMNEAAEPFINDNYELYGREIDLIYVRGECQAVPPDYPCLRNEMRQIVQQHNPFWVVWNTSLASPAFDELSRLEVMNSGGWSFRDVFNQRRRPYHWDLLMGGTQLVNHVAEWYCKRLHGGNAVYSGEQDDMRDKPRVLGVISTDDPENKLAIDTLKSELGRRCGASVAHEYYYAQDITTAEQQRDAAVDEMQEDPEATTVMCFCDLVAPLFLYAEAEERGYYPEHVLVGTGFMDVDSAAQPYDTTLGEKDQFENAFGLAMQNNQVNEFENTAAKIWQRTGHEGKAYNANTDWNYYGMVANLVQMAGPDLNPFNVEKGSVRLGAIAPGSNQNENFHQRSFDPASGDYTWIDTMREVYWSTENTSEFNGQPGTYVSLNGGRWFLPGQYPRGALELPPKPR